MMAQASVQINVESAKALERAYDTLLFMRTAAGKTESASRINQKLLFASVRGTFAVPSGLTSKTIFFCLVTVKKVDDGSCELTISADEMLSMDNTSSAAALRLISDFLELLSQRIDT